MLAHMSFKFCVEVSALSDGVSDSKSMSIGIIMELFAEIIFKHIDADIVKLSADLHAMFSSVPHSKLGIVVAELSCEPLTLLFNTLPNEQGVRELCQLRCCHFSLLIDAACDTLGEAGKERTNITNML